MFAAGVQHATNITLYEGLPHPMFEEPEFERESKSAATVMLNGFPFYAEKLHLNDADRQSLQNLVCTSDTFAAFSAEKKCGGFHPGYCLEWRSASGDVW